MAGAIILPREKHCISRANISKNALLVLNRLNKAGYSAHLVGGSVRDLLLGIKPKDFDIATDAHPEDIRRLFRNCRLIGRRFRLAHILFGPEIIEVATFRAPHPEAESHPEARQSHTGMLLRDNVYGTHKDDAQRRDFSINALYYNIANFSVIDFTGGLADLEKHTIRILGDAEARYKEDPVRMLRALRLAAKLDFVLDHETAKPIKELSHLIEHVSPVRIFDEILKLFYCGHALRAFRLLCHYGLFNKLFSQTAAALALDSSISEPYLALIVHNCKNTDLRIQQQQSLNPAFLFAAFLWPALQQQIKAYAEKGQHHPYTTLQMATQQVLNRQLKETAVPKRYTAIIQEIWAMQFPLEQRPKRRVHTLFTSLRFRAAYDFLLLRLEAGETHLKPSVDWWQAFQVASADERQEKISHLTNPRPRKKRKKKK